MGTEERAVGAEVGTSNIQEAFLVREMVSSDEPQGITDLVNEDDGVAVEVHEDSSKAGTESLPIMSVAVAELGRGTLCELPLGKAQVDNDKERDSTITKPSGDVRAGLQPSHYADIDFSKKGPIPAPKNEMYTVVYAEIKKWLW